MAQYRPQIMGAFCRLLLCGLAVAIAGCGNKGPGTGPAAAGRVPLTELGMETYKGFGGGLYPAGGNVEPTAHAAAGQSRAQAVTPLDTSGTPNAGGKNVGVVARQGEHDTGNRFRKDPNHELPPL